MDPTTPASEFLKYDAGKLLFSLIDPEFLKEIAEVLTYGAKKYSPENWKLVEAKEGIRRYTDAYERHWNSYRRGELRDAESGYTHLAHCAVNLMYIAYFERQLAADQGSPEPRVGIREVGRTVVSQSVDNWHGGIFEGGKHQ